MAISQSFKNLQNRTWLSQVSYTGPSTDKSEISIKNIITCRSMTILRGKLEMNLKDRSRLEIISKIDPG